MHAHLRQRLHRQKDIVYAYTYDRTRALMEHGCSVLPASSETRCGNDTHLTPGASDEYARA